MREIKFRAWDGNKLIEGVTPFQWDFLIDRTHWRCILHDSEGHPVFEVEGIPFTELMQYTGLKDKNGKEIYEGDIVQHYKYGGNYPVVYSCDNTGYDLKHKHGSMHLSSACCPELEVIGNIYETPELLDGKQ